jgi:hypothetical protein
MPGSQRFFPLLLLSSSAFCQDWSGLVHDSAKQPLGSAIVTVHSSAGESAATTDASGRFQFPSLRKGLYTVSVDWQGNHALRSEAIQLPVPGLAQLTASESGTLTIQAATAQTATGGEQLSSQAVSGLPLNKRDFSALLLLAAGTMTDSNGTSNFTAQFAINGQRGVEAVFAMDGADISDPEMGGATFSNFNVDAVEEIQSSSGWMAAEIGRGAAGFTNILTRSGMSGFHGSIFEFVRNSAFDARNFFDHRSVANPGRIPPFRRNEFGFTNGGSIIRNKTFYFVEYQAFRQVLGTTQVIPVPTLAERAGIDTTAFAGDTLYVPVDPRISKLIDRYPLPNDSLGPYGARTYATSSKVTTNADQFSARLDHRLSSKARLFGRFSFDNLTGPTTNPSQTAIDPAFGIQYVDHQRNGVVTYSRTVSPNFSWESSVSATRTTPSFPTADHTDPELVFSNGLYEAFNSAGGSVTAAYGNLFQGRQSFAWIKGRHSFKAGAEFRANRDTTYFVLQPNGQFTFGGGAAYAPIAIRSQSGLHDVATGAALPDTLSALLTASAFSYSIGVAPAYFPQGTQTGVAADSRDNAAFFFEDTWKASPRWTINLGLRYELYTPISERAHRTSGLRAVAGPNGVQEQYVINPQPGYVTDKKGFGPRLQIGWEPAKDLQIHAGGALTTIPPNIWQDNSLTGGTPFVLYPHLTAAPGAPIPFGFAITPAQIPRVYTPAGVDIFANGDTKQVPANTVMDVDRLERDIAGLTPGHQITPLNLTAIAPSFRNAYLATWTFGVERKMGALDFNAGYIGTAAIHLAAMDFPNGYAGADPSHAPYTQFDSLGRITGGLGTTMIVTDRSHSSYHALQTSVQGSLGRLGPGVQASYTWSKSIDDTSSVIGGFISGNSGASVQAWPQDPFNTRAEKGLSTFDTPQAFTASVVQDFHLDRVNFLAFLPKRATSGWQFLSISTVASGTPFTVYSGVQQTGVGSNGVDRPDLLTAPVFSTSRKIREDYFGLGANNASFFSIPAGQFGALGRDTFRGPGFHNFDFALIKDTTLAAHSSGGEIAVLQFRAEFFNLFNIVNFGLPSNIVKGTGFGEISRTAGTSRQIQFSIKLIF